MTYVTVIASLTNQRISTYDKKISPVGPTPYHNSILFLFSQSASVKHVLILSSELLVYFQSYRLAGGFLTVLLYAFPVFFIRFSCPDHQMLHEIP